MVFIVLVFFTLSQMTSIRCLTSLFSIGNVQEKKRKFFFPMQGLGFYCSGVQVVTSGDLNFAYLKNVSFTVQLTVRQFRALLKVHLHSGPWIEKFSICALGMVC